ncbi:MAG: IPT/TIG domain-containing protein [bacterium]|nr:IPT/TIG domain-containing protein [bacterium]
MKHNVFIKRLPLALVLLALAWAGCEYDTPASVWDPGADLGTFPEITGVSPDGRAGAGVHFITINGQGFASDASKNTVYVGTARAEVTAATASSLTILRPNITGDGLAVKVLVEGAYGIGQFPGYAVDAVNRLYGNKNVTGFIQFMGVDRSENIYVLTTTKSVTKIDATEAGSAFGANKSKKKNAGIVVGPDGAAYLIEAGGTALNRIPVEGGDSVKLADFPATPKGFDFDAQGAAVGVGDKNGLQIILSDLTNKSLTEFNDLSAVWVKCYRGSVYVTDGTGVWKSTIAADYSSATPKEKVFDIADVPGYADSKILSFVMDQDGNLVVCTNKATDPIFQILADGTPAPFYKGILPASCGGHLVYGGSRYIYLNMQQLAAADRDILRIDAGRNEAGK